MERFWCYLVGFVVALVLVTGFLFAKDKAEDVKSLCEQKIRLIAKEECWNLKKNIYWNNIIGFERHVNALVDKRLAEKERENEGD